MAALETAVRMLARREHSAFELRRKLQQKHFGNVEIDDAVEQLQRDGLLSDERFAESYIHMRVNRGYGPHRIALELKEKGVAEPDFRHYLNDGAIDWISVLKQAYEKKYSGKACSDYQDKAKRVRYLQYRGFALETIHEVIDLN